MAAVATMALFSALTFCIQGTHGSGRHGQDLRKLLREVAKVELTQDLVKLVHYSIKISVQLTVLLLTDSICKHQVAQKALVVLARIIVFLFGAYSCLLHRQVTLGALHKCTVALICVAEQFVHLFVLWMAVGTGAVCLQLGFILRDTAEQPHVAILWHEVASFIVATVIAQATRDAVVLVLDCRGGGEAHEAHRVTLTRVVDGKRLDLVAVEAG